VVLHDHLDGGLRVATVIELADEVGHSLPTSQPDELAAWFRQDGSGSLESYLEAFDHTVAVMQTRDAIRRVAEEALLDLAADGVVYAEVRFDPGLCTRAGLDRFDVVEAALDGCEAARRATRIEYGLIISALRHHDDADAAVAAAVRFLGEGVVAFDLAGPERGFHHDDHLSAIMTAHRAGLGVTIHAGEGDGPHSMWRAIALCGAERVGHGVRIADDTDFDGAQITRLGALARRVRDHRIPLEVAVTSNIQTGTHAEPGVHPFGALYRAGFAVSINTDNRLMSGVTLSSEYELAATSFGLSRRDLGRITVSALEAGFGSWPTRRRLIEDVVRPAYDPEANSFRSIQSAMSPST